MLFVLMKQCCQGIGLMEWTKVVAKCCPEENDLTNDSFNFTECQKGCLEAIVGFSSIGDQLICGFHTA
jgi:hypothetical protein